MKSISSLLALLLGSVAVTVGVACEGEPPKTAESAVTTPTPPVAAPEESATAAAEPATTCCQCNCPGGHMVPIGGDAGASVAVATDAGTADAAAVATMPTRGQISGDITTTPAYLKGVSVVWLEDAPKDGDANGPGGLAAVPAIMRRGQPTPRGLPAVRVGKPLEA